MQTTANYLPTDSANTWAKGCKECRYGIVSAPELTGACELHLERLVQALDKSITFCECQAGTRLHVYLLNRRQALIEEARRKSPSLAARNTHAEIESARNAIQHSYAMRVPTVHGAEGVTP